MWQILGYVSAFQLLEFVVLGFSVLNRSDTLEMSKRECVSVFLFPLIPRRYVGISAEDIPSSVFQESVKSRTVANTVFYPESSNTSPPLTCLSFYYLTQRPKTYLTTANEQSHLRQPPTPALAQVQLTDQQQQQN